MVLEGLNKRYWPLGTPTALVRAQSALEPPNAIMTTMTTPEKKISHTGVGPTPLSHNQIFFFGVVIMAGPPSPESYPKL